MATTDRPAVSVPALWLVAVLLLWTTPSHAQVLRRESRHLSREDRHNLLRVIRSILPPGKELDSPVSECLNLRNALAWGSTRPYPTSDGGVEWWSLLCRRNSHAWSCDTPEHHLQGLIRLWLSVGVNTSP
jgi:hypothetical protein